MMMFGMYMVGDEEEDDDIMVRYSKWLCIVRDGVIEKLSTVRSMTLCE